MAKHCILRSLAGVAAAGAMFMACAPVEPARDPGEGQAEPVSASADEARVLARIAEERSLRSLQPAVVATEDTPIDSAMRLIERGARPEDAVRSAMTRLAEAESTEIRGWLVETADLEQVELPSVLVERAEVTLAVRVVRYRKSDAQEHFLVCFLVFEDGAGDIGEG
jgi:hypothetical protein